MTVHAVSRWSVGCDSLYCSALTEQYNSRTVARQRAALDGWLIATDVGDYCPDCAPDAPITPEARRMAEESRRHIVEQLRGFGHEECTCGARFDDELHLERRAWFDLHLEAARRRGDDFWHAEVPF